MGIEEALGFEFIRHFAHERLARRQDTVFRPARKPPDFLLSSLAEPPTTTNSIPRSRNSAEQSEASLAALRVGSVSAEIFATAALTFSAFMRAA
jgi:hypothetical protein